MPTISVDYTDLIQLIGKEYSYEELEALMIYIKGELKKHTSAGGRLRIELKDTNRPDLWCPEGIARQIRFLFQRQDYSALTSFAPEDTEKRIDVNKNMQPIRPYIAAFCARGVSVTAELLDQLIQTQEKLCDNYGKKRELAAIGIYDAGSIRFPVQYKAVTPHTIRFTPLGCERDMDLNEILTCHPKGVEYGPILHGKELVPILTGHDGKVLSLPPVINSRQSGEVAVGDDYLFVEVTGTDLNMALHMANILVYNLYDRGWTIEPVATIYPYETGYGHKIIAPYPLDNRVEIEQAFIGRYLGYSYDETDLCEAFEKYGLMVDTKAASGRLGVSSYPYRQDYMHAVDAVEDAAIVMGYNTFEPLMPERFTIGHMNLSTLKEDRVREIMTGMGFEEVILNMLCNKSDFDASVATMNGPLLEVSNPMTQNYAAVRNALFPALLKVEAASSKAFYPHRVCEVGEVVIDDAADNHQWITRSHLGALMAHPEANFSEAGSYLMQLSYQMFWNIRIQPKPFAPFIPGRSAAIMVADECVGMLGEVHPEILDAWQIKMPVTVFELNISVL